jgi:hypothetical protein
MNQKPQILVILQNFYVGPGKRRKLKHPIYDVRIINRKNATYSRIVPYLEPHFEIFFTECTPMIGNDHREKFDTDLEWLNQAISNREWHAIIAFGQQAEMACRDLGLSNVIVLPHPVSFKWRKIMIVETIQNLITTQNGKTEKNDGH